MLYLLVDFGLRYRMAISSRHSAISQKEAPSNQQLALSQSKNQEQRQNHFTAKGAEENMLEPYANWGLSCSSVRQTGMKWADTPQTHAKLGSGGIEGEGVARDRVIGTSGDLVIGKG